MSAGDGWDDMGGGMLGSFLKWVAIIICAIWVILFLIFKVF